MIFPANHLIAAKNGWNQIKPQPSYNTKKHKHRYTRIIHIQSELNIMKLNPDLHICYAIWLGNDEAYSTSPGACTGMYVSPLNGRGVNWLHFAIQV